MNLVRFTTANGTMVLVESDDEVAAVSEDEGRGGRRLVARGQADTIKEARSSFDDAIQTIRPVIEGACKALAGLSVSEAELTVGIKFSGEVGIILAKSTLDATLQIKAKITPTSSKAL